MSTFQQDGRLITLETPLGKDVFLATAFDGDEKMNQLFEFQVSALSSLTQVEANQIVGRTVTVSIQAVPNSKPARQFHAFVNRLSQGQSYDDGLIEYRLNLVPALWVLTQSQHHRLWTQKNVVDIVKDVVGSIKKIQAVDTSKLTASNYIKRELCVQFGESDFDFLSRLLAEEGINYYFQHDQGAHTLVLADAKQHFFDCSSEPVPYVNQPGFETHNTISQWASEYNYHVGKVSLSDYNEQTPGNAHKASASTLTELPNITLSEYQSCFDYHFNEGQEGDHQFDAGMKQQQAKRLIEQAEMRAEISKGHSSCSDFCAGGRFKFKPVDLQSTTPFLLTEVRHRAFESPQGERVYENSFHCLPLQVMPRPERPKTLPRVEGPQTAVVEDVRATGPGTDKLAQVKIKFHWAGQQSACWVRVGQLAAGSKWGGYFIPAIGQEVIVQFINGNPNRPLVTGALYNAENTAPEYSKTQSGFRTSSQDYNELKFEDKAGSEAVLLRAGKDLLMQIQNDQETTVEHDQMTTIKNNRSLTVSEGDDTVKIGKGNRNVTVAGSDTLKSQKTIAHSAGQKIELKVGGSSLTISSSAIELKLGASSVKLDPSGVQIKGTLIKLNGSAMAEVKASGMVKVQGGVTMIN